EFLTDALSRLEDVPVSAERDRAECLVRAALGPALVASNGWFDPQVSDNYERVLQLSVDSPDGPEAAAARYGLATVSELRGTFARTEDLLTPLLVPRDEGPLTLEAHELVACSNFHQGAFARSLRNAEMVLESWDEETYSVPMARIAEHPASSCSSWSSLALWALGRSDESLAQAERAVIVGERNLYALSTAVQQRAMFHQLRGEIEACIHWSDRCREVGEDQDFPMRVVQADMYRGWALGVSGAAGEGLAMITDGIDRFRAADVTLNEPYYVGLYADVSLQTGDPDRAGALVLEAVGALTSRSYFYESELHRIGAGAALARDEIDIARDGIQRSRAVARELESPALELRTLLDSVSFERIHGDPAEAEGALTTLLSIYEGQAPTPDTIRARELLAS
ncbi:MAG: hypothetical protein ACR2PK_12190, partial [Acidimicrobiales bacterium]